MQVRGAGVEVALQLAELAHRKLPESPEVADTLGWVHLRRNMPSMALPLLEQASRNAPSNAAIAYHLGTAYLELGRRSDALAAFQLAIKAGPGTPEGGAAKRAMAAMFTVSSNTTMLPWPSRAPAALKAS